MDSSQGDLEDFRAVTDHFKQDIREFFTRSNFYLVAEGGLLAIFFAKVTKTMPTTTFEYILNVKRYINWTWSGHLLAFCF
jgi:hypothetical protein